MSSYQPSTNSIKPVCGDNNSELQIFLGGSCNPTTWRQNIAIPFLKMNSISYYNPQIDNWTPEVVHIERQAKQNAKFLLFVIDKQTRSTVSLVESAFMAGDNKNLVLVIFPYNGEIAGHVETFELRQARHLLRSLVSKQKIPMFNDILQALTHITTCLHKENNPRDPLSPIGASHCSLECTTDDSNRETDDKTRDVYLSVDSDDRACIVSTVIPMLEENGLTYNNTADSTSASDSFTFITPGDAADNFSDQEIKQSFEGAMDRETCAMRSSRVLLFVITNKCRGLSMMVLASHFMALFRDNVVLCIQYLEKPCSVGGETLSSNAIDDYNRGRLYLQEYARETRVPVFKNIREAIEFCSRKCRHNNKT